MESGKLQDIVRALFRSLHLNRQNWSARLVWRYMLLQIPGIALLAAILIVIQRWVEFPTWFIWAALIVWVIKDAALFPLVWRAYDWDRAGEANSMVGLRGVVQKPLSPAGSVRIRGELWQARVTGDSLPLDQGEIIQVQEIRGLTLLVERYPKADGSSAGTAKAEGR